MLNALVIVGIIAGAAVIFGVGFFIWSMTYHVMANHTRIMALDLAMRSFPEQRMFELGLQNLTGIMTKPNPAGYDPTDTPYGLKDIEGEQVEGWSPPASELSDGLEEV